MKSLRPPSDPGDSFALSAPGTMEALMERAGIQPFRQPSGGYRQKNVFHYVVGQV